MSFCRVFSCPGVLLMSVLSFGAPLTAMAQSPLSLAEGERLALEQAPGLARAHTSVAAAAERVTYEGRLPDPQLTLGAINVPANSFSFREEDMTMKMIGVRQAFPPGDTLNIRTRRAEQQLAREQARLEIGRRNLLRQVRAFWFDLYLANQSLKILEESRQLARRDLEAAEGRYRAAQESQRTVFVARQVLARVNEREPMLRAQAARLRAQLQRFIGAAAQAPLPEALPALSALPGDFDPTRHPEWLAAQAELETMRAEVDMARQDYKPGVMLDLSYGFRRPMPDGTERPNMVTAMVTLDLPIFRSKRQDRRLAEKQALEAGARLETEDKRREVETMYAAMRAEYDALAARAKIIEEQLLPAIRRETQVTIAGFAREQTTLREARLKEFDTNLELLRLRVDLAKTHAELLYLTGDAP
jgi:outer membrane protein TolC